LRKIGRIEKVDASVSETLLVAGLYHDCSGIPPDFNGVAGFALTESAAGGTGAAKNPTVVQSN
jgi:hypothetical protein